MEPTTVPFYVFQNVTMELQTMKILAEQNHAAYISTLSLLHQAHQEVSILRRELQTSKTKVKFLNSKVGYWDLTKTARWRRKQKLTVYLKRCMESLPKEFEPLEVSSKNFYLIIEFCIAKSNFRSKAFEGILKNCFSYLFLFFPVYITWHKLWAKQCVYRQYSSILVVHVLT